MPRSRLRALLVALLSGTAVALAACTDVGPGPVSPVVTGDGFQRIAIRFANSEVDGGVRRFAVPRGAIVEIVVGSDVADEVHVHGYDRSSFVTAGATTALRFVADVPGVFEVELERRGTPLAELEVS